MDGATALYRLRNLLNEPLTGEYLDTRTSYDYLYEAATMAVVRSRLLTSTQSITTVADQTDYTLSADFLQLWLKNEENQLYIKYNDGSNESFIIWSEYEDIVYANNTTSTTIPTHFTIVDDSLPAQVTRTTTSAGAASGGQCTLTDTSGDFSDVAAGDIVHNTTDGSVGVVLSKTSSTVLVTALFSGTSDDWSNGDTYIIQPQGRVKLVLDPPPSTASHTITVNYVQRPAPVYSDYGRYRFSIDQMPALVKYAAWLYKYRDREPDFGDAFYLAFERQFRKGASATGRKFNRGKFTMTMKKHG